MRLVPYLGSLILAAAAQAESPWYGDYKIVQNAVYPSHAMLLKHPKLNQDGSDIVRVSSDRIEPQDAMQQVCPGATAGYTGYLVAGTKHFFFSYFESRSAPTTDPLVLWTNGGPGCSGLIGMLTEHGPCQIQDDGTTIKNEHAWTNTANMIYLEQPLGVGFSFDSSNTTSVNTTLMAAEDLLVFLDLWYSHFPQHRQSELHLSGESYAGHYLPVFAKAILTHNDVVQADKKIPLESIIIGNGQYDLAIQEMTIYNMTCTTANGIGGPVLDTASCAEMEAVVVPCTKLFQACSATLRDAECQPAYDRCSPYTEVEFLKSNRSIYDIRVSNKGGRPNIPLTKATADFVNSARVRAAFGAMNPSVKTWYSCSDDIFNAFFAANDLLDASAPILKELLDRDFRVFIFHGLYDVICNYIGAEKVLSGLPWHGLNAFNSAARTPRNWSGGQYWEADTLRYSRVNNAGHFVPSNVPEAALELFQAWLEKRPMR